MKDRIAKWMAVAAISNLIHMALLAVVCAVILGWNSTVPHWFVVYMNVTVLHVVISSVAIFVMYIKQIIKAINDL